MIKVSVHIVTWNSRKYLENALGSLTEQTFQDFTILIIDNNSGDDTVAWLKEHYPQLKVVQNTRNLGFAKGHNQAIQFSQSQYVLVMNPDIILTKTYLESLVRILEAEPRAGSCVGKIYKLANEPHQLDKADFGKEIDTLGLKAYKSRRVTDRASGEIDHGQYDKAAEIFGVSGSLALYRREALEEVALPVGKCNYKEVDSSTLSRPPLGKGKRREYFDEDFYSYTEDVDLAWRLRLRNWQSVYWPEAIAYHHRAIAGKDSQGNIATAINRQAKPVYAHKLSYRNHLWLLVKNEQNFWRHFFYIIYYELKKLGYIILFEPKTLIGLWQFFGSLSKMRAKRKIIHAKAKVSAKQMSKWFN